MDELTLRLECLRCACAARTTADVLAQAKSYLDWVTNMGQIAADEYRPNFDLTQLQREQVKDLIVASPIDLGEEERQKIVDDVYARIKRVLGHGEDGAPVAKPKLTLGAKQ